MERASQEIKRNEETKLQPILAHDDETTFENVGCLAA
jgi:hypothetical protein